MNTVLVSSFGHPIALGLRYVSGYLKAAGCDVEMIFMCSRRDTAEVDFPPAALEAYVERCRRADLIGVSLMTNTFYRARFLTETLRQAGVKAPIIWGGTHATVAPAESLGVADVVCVGEGEEPMLQLIECMEAGTDPTGVPGLWFRAKGPFGNASEVHNPVPPLHDNLDEYPFPDYELDTHWVVDGDELARATEANLRGALRRLRVESTRGCPYRCTFCNNTAWARIYKGRGAWVRRRSSENVIAEIEKACACFPSIEEINIVDDLFFVRSEEEMADFVDQYTRRVNLPIQLDAFPNTVTEGKIAVLSKLPIDLISMGIQSGSPRTLLDIYERRTSLERIADAMDLFHKYRLRAEYHYIVGNPYEPDAHVIETMRFAATHHRGPAALRIFPLALYPGSPLYDRARADGIIPEHHEGAYQHTYSAKVRLGAQDYLATWLRVVLHLRNIAVPRWLVHRLIDVVTHPWVRRVLDRKAFMPVAMVTHQVGRRIYKTLIHEPFVRPIASIRRRRQRKARKRRLGQSLTDSLAGIDDSGIASAGPPPGRAPTRPVWTPHASERLARRRLAARQAARSA